MYQIETNFGSYTCRLSPSVTDIMKYYHLAHQKGIAIPNIKFLIKEIPTPKASISTILKDVA